MRDIIEIGKDLIPYNFDILLGQEEFNIYIMYNSVTDSFSATLSKNGEVLVDNEPLVYGIPLFQDVFNEKFPCLDIVPYDESGQVDEITWDNFGTLVLLTIDDEGDENVNTK